MVKYCCAFVFCIACLQYMYALTQEIDAEDSMISQQFMTEAEYGKYLYQEPRGIGCQKCHGEDGKGKQLVSYTHKGKNMEINAPDITELDLQGFTHALRKTHAVMPKYYLTDSEIYVLYKYITTHE
ncbi:c-type cytochrome [Helicobacter trogontum]|uniref:Cytochrome c n=1 Tax=Helicobacter trogontum TaxID=50960 RepID=A0A4U8SC93_9HELI|nr:c-type cytochrome [Helicobacter trogontum]TLD83748.1 cytochrome c [Helicobacter trogontum]